MWSRVLIVLLYNFAQLYVYFSCAVRKCFMEQSQRENRKSSAKFIKVRFITFQCIALCLFWNWLYMNVCFFLHDACLGNWLYGKLKLYNAFFNLILIYQKYQSIDKNKKKNSTEKKSTNLYDHRTVDPNISVDRVRDRQFYMIIGLLDSNLSKKKINGILQIDIFPK